MFCAVCFGDPNSPLTHGYQYGIFTLLAIVVAVLIGLASMFLGMRNRIKKQSLHG